MATEQRVGEHDVRTSDGRTLRAYDARPDRADAPVVVWHHGSPHSGRLLAPLLEPAVERGIHLVTYARPAYGGSTPRPGRDVASAADDVAHVADALGLGRFAVLGHSGGGPHALACAALLADRVTAAASLSGPAPWDGDEAWFAGMRSDAALRAATQGREARARLAEVEEFDEETFTAADWAALSGPWAALGEDASDPAATPDGLVDDDVAFVSPWGFDLADVRVPTLVLHGGQDRMVPPSHAARLGALLPGAEARLLPEDGHISVLREYGAVLDRLTGR
ncbi:MULTISPECIES: alpha/beta fold hydrolase [unclassified Actinotalea]|uniref:alpha/beta fold hydrolase n=1 Tax=unclassified Actinotalea TaxID=2638618 RepID=UPI0015F656EF|nr:MULTISPECIES: alpha/beta fold hydrolase [unclassified Actinotalea]